MQNFIDTSTKDLINKTLLVKDERGIFELEARFNDYLVNKGIDGRTFLRLQEYFSNTSYPNEKLLTEDQNISVPSGTLRLTRVYESTGTRKFLIQKTVVPGFPVLLKDYAIKINISLEENL